MVEFLILLAIFLVAWLPTAHSLRKSKLQVTSWKSTASGLADRLDVSSRKLMYEQDKAKDLEDKAKDLEYRLGFIASLGEKEKSSLRKIAKSKALSSLLDPSDNGSYRLIRTRGPRKLKKVRV